MVINPLHLIDFYKVDHRRQYPPGTTLVFTNGTFRGSRIADIDHIIFFGLQYIIKEYLINQFNEGFFKKDKQVVLSEYRCRVQGSLGIGDFSTDHIAALHDLGYLPIEIMALPEGSRVPLKVAPFVMFNTHPEFFWLVNYLETLVSSTLWQACTSATLAYEFKKQFLTDAEKTTGIWPHPAVDFQGHDFSFRGMSSVESAMLSGAGHLLSFQGTDTVPTIDFLEQYYHGKGPIGFSVPATEHSVMCMHGKEEEIETLKYLLDLYPTGIFSAVCDSWDFWKVLTEYLPTLKELILSRDGKFVVRPDSGNPVDIICGDRGHSWFREDYKELTDENGNYIVDYYGKLDYNEGKTIAPSQYKGAIEILWEIFGGTTNEAGYKELDPHIGLIYGDSITRERAAQINRRLEAKGFASINWVAGIGSYTYQYNTRDTFGFAMKATYGELTKQLYPFTEKDWVTEQREIFKDPITDGGIKKSAKGLIAVYADPNRSTIFTPMGLYQKDQATWEEVRNCEFSTVFKDGKEFESSSLEDIRILVKQNLDHERAKKKA